MGSYLKKKSLLFHLADTSEDPCLYGGVQYAGNSETMRPGRPTQFLNNRNSFTVFSGIITVVRLSHEKIS